MARERNGLLAAGNFIMDHVKIIDAYPEPEMLTTIRAQSSSNGGGPYNVLKDLAKLGAPFPLEAAGLIGDDADGEWILSDCQKHHIATWGMARAESAATSYTDAMTVADTGQRTFFHHRGANAIFGQKHIDLSRSRARWFYLGYLLLLDQMDALDGEGSTQASKVLEEAKRVGFHTVVDFVSVPDKRAKAIAKASLPHVDLLFINEIEAGFVTGDALRSANGPNWQAAESAASALFAMGVRESVVIHFMEGAIAMHADGSSDRHGSARVPGDAIVGSTGAGDAFAAGVIYGRHENWSWPESLELGVCAAAVSLGAGPPSDAMLPAAQCLEKGRAWGYRSMP